MKNIGKVIIFLITAIISFNNITAVPSQNDFSETSLKQITTFYLREEIQDTYYKEYPLEFLKRKLITEPNSKISIGLLNHFFIILSDIAFFLMITKLALQAFNSSLSSNIIMLLTTIITLWFNKIIYDFCYNKCKESDFEKYSFEALIEILNNYDPSIKSTCKINNKNYIPQKLHIFFDKLHNIYKKYDTKVLYDTWNIIKKTLIANLETKN